MEVADRLPGRGHRWHPHPEVRTTALFRLHRLQKGYRTQFSDPAAVPLSRL